jgi:predicted DCC family thiol-disulfide oxidoreductase YuxK
MQEYPEIVLFDGVCNLCSSSVQYIIARERRPTWKFASLQSETGKTLLKKYGLENRGIDSIVLIMSGKAYTKSGAVLRLTKRMKGLYPLLFGFIIIPPFIRNAVYDWIARNRYKWYGKQESCMMPDPALKARFVDI